MTSASQDSSPSGEPHALDETNAAVDSMLDDERTIELREEELVAHKELRELGQVSVSTRIEEVPGHLEVDAYTEEVHIQHEPIGQVVNERREPWQEDGAMVVPIYEEQLVVSKRLVLKEHLRITRVRTNERRLFEETLRRERLVVEDPRHTGLIREQYPTDIAPGEQRLDSQGRVVDSGERPDDTEQGEQQSAGGFLEHIARRVLE
jgi:uncharacterized protein (TIGR02271 family)